MATFCEGIVQNIVQNIERTECIGNSLAKINNNFSGLEIAGCALETRIDAIEEIIGGSSPTLIGIRLSYSSTTPTPVTDIKNATTLYVHPYKGNIIPLYDTTTNKWTSYKITQPLNFSLAGLLADTNYDVYLYYSSNTIQAEFVAWPSSIAGGSLPPRQYVDTVAVKPSEANKRLVGCLRTTIAGESEQSFGGNVAGGAHPKQYLWNAQNTIPVTTYSFEVGSYYAVGGTNGTTGYRRVNPTNYTLDTNPWGNTNPVMIATPGSGRNNRFSFIVGDNTLVNMISQIYGSYYTNLAQLVAYTAVGINNETSPTTGQGSQLISELRGSDMTPRAQLLKAFDGGYNYLQMFENVHTGPGVRAVMNETHANQTGFLAHLYN